MRNDTRTNLSKQGEDVKCQSQRERDVSSESDDMSKNVGDFQDDPGSQLYYPESLKLPCMEQQQLQQQQQQQQDSETESTVSSISSKKEKVGIKRKLDVDNRRYASPYDNQALP